MKIVHIATYPKKGQKHVKGSGVASYTKNLLTHTRLSASDKAYVLCDITPGQQPSTYAENDLEIRRCFYRRPSFIWRIYQQVRSINPDVIHVQQELSLFGGNLTAYLLQWLLFALRKWPIALTIHGVVDPSSIDREFVRQNNCNFPVWLVKIGFWAIYKPLTIWPRQIVVHEQQFKQILISRYHVEPSKIQVIPHGVEPLQPESKTSACQSLGLDPESNIIMFMGYLTGYKGLDLLIDGFSAYAAQNPKAYLVIGAGPHPKLENNPEYAQEYARLQQKAQAKIPSNQYKWAGFIPESQIKTYYSAADASVYPYTISMSSSGPMSLAIGYEKPFLASQAFSDMFDQQLLFDGHPQAFADKLSHFFNNPHTYGSISSQLKDVRSWGRGGEQTLSLYRGLSQ